jgi:undecaprenyl-diphosphatase
MQDLDSRAVGWLAGLDLPVLTPAMKAATYAGAWGIAWLAIALVVALRRRDPRPFLVTAATALVATGVSSGLKALTDRDRPPVADPDLHALIAVPGSSSLPSGHALTSFACAMVLSAYAPHLRWPLLALAALIAISRVYLGVHYPSDVLAGAALGAALGWGIARVLPPRSPPPAPAPRVDHIQRNC